MDGYLGREESGSVELHRNLLVADGWLWMFSDKIQSLKDFNSGEEDLEEWGYLLNKRGR